MFLLFATDAMHIVSVTNRERARSATHLHVAIDRFTGEIIDQQLEAVYE
jgi:hypothetical protein